MKKKTKQLTIHKLSYEQLTRCLALVHWLLAYKSNEVENQLAISRQQIGMVDDKRREQKIQRVGFLMMIGTALIALEKNHSESQ